MKNYDNNYCVCESQSAADMSLALFGAMNGWKCVLFLKHELSRVLLVSNNHAYIKKKQNNTWVLGDVEIRISFRVFNLISNLCTALTREILSRPLEEKSLHAHVLVST